MKTSIFIAASAIALALFFVIGEVYGWGTSCSTSRPASSWQGCHSTATQATATGTVYVYVTAPYTSATNCGTRFASAHRDSDEAVMQTVTCPGSGPGGTPECCIIDTWDATVDVWYYVKASQTSTGAASCGPTTGSINSTYYNCDPESP